MNDVANTASADAAAPDNVQSTALAVIRSKVPTILAADKKDLLGRLKAELDAIPRDATTPEGRKALASGAYKIRTTKADLDRLGRSLTEDWREKIKAVNDERRAVEQLLNELHDQFRAPLTEYENRDKLRVAEHEAALREIESWAEIPDDWTSAQVAARIADLSSSPLLNDRDWQEFAEKAQTTATRVYNTLDLARMRRAEAEAKAAEQERLAAEEAERQWIAEQEARKLREEQIAREAAEAAKREAEEKAAREAAEAEEAARREREAAAERERAAARREQLAREAAERAEREKAEAEARAEKQRLATHQMHLANLRAYPRGLSDDGSSGAYRQLIGSLTRALQARDWEEFAAEAAEAATASETELKGMLALAEQREAAAAEARHHEAEQRAAEAAERARVEERRRQEEEAARKAAEEKRRAENLEHKRKINQAAAAAIAETIADALPVAATDAIAQAIVTAIAREEIPSVFIRY